MEWNKWKVPMPEKTLSWLRACKTDLWLIPKGERPFMMIGYYGVPMLNPSFADTFQDSYAKAKSFKFFDAWVCRK